MTLLRKLFIAALLLLIAFGSGFWLGSELQYRGDHELLQRGCMK